jgi:hypothetical protein
MRALHSSLPPKRHLSPEWRQALQLLASSPRGTTEDMLVLGHGLSRGPSFCLGNAPLRAALACRERRRAPDASRCPGPCSAGKPRKGRGFACLLAQMPARLPSCHGLEHAACVRRWIRA